MNDSETTRGRPRLEWYVWSLAAMWTVAIAVSLAWNIATVRQNNLEVARIQARAAYEKDVVYRRWNTGHGGVYVPVTQETQPNPYLSDLPERDITTPSGRLLTLMNPAYMTRQVHELADEEYGVRGHITSLNPIRPENAPDSWETEALRAFERGETEVSSVEEMDGKEYSRLMRPLLTEQGCLACHAQQGYQEGDIRGGISGSIPTEPLRAVESSHRLKLAMSHGLMWLMGLGVIVLGGQRLIRSVANTKTLEKEIAERTRLEAALRESGDQFQDLYENAPNAYFSVGTDGIIRRCNRRAGELLGYEVGDLMGRTVLELYADAPQGKEKAAELFQRFRAGETAHGEELLMQRADGTPVWVSLRVNTVQDAQGQIVESRSIVVDITERKRAEEELRRVYRALGVLSECNQAVIRATGESDLLHEICRIAVEVGGYRLAWVGFAEKDIGKTVSPMAQKGFEAGYFDTVDITWADTERRRGPTGTAIRSGLPSVARHILTDPSFEPWRAEAVKRGYASSIAFPLIAHGLTIGALTIYAGEPDAFNTEEVNLLAELADDLAFGIVTLRTRAEWQRAERALQEAHDRLEQRVAERTTELQERADELAALYEVGRDLAAILDLEVLLPAIAQRVTDALEADRCTVFLFDEATGVLRARAAHGYMAERLADFSYRPGEEIVGQAYATGGPQYVPDLDLVPDLPRRDEIRAVLAIPLVSPTAGPLGVLSVTSLRPAAFTSNQQRLLATMAGQISAAIENSRLHEETERHATQLAVLYEVGKEITSTLELDTMLQIIAADAVRLAGADKGLILLIDAERERLTRAVGHGYSQAQLDGHIFEEFQDGISGWILREKVPTLSADIQTDKRNTAIALESAQKSGDRSAAIAPLIIGDEVIGTLTVVNSRRRRVFTPADLDMVTMLAEQAAIAIQNARLYETAQEADRLKSAFLASMSHELRTPLNSIIGFIGIILQGLVGPLNSEQEKQLNMVYGSARHLLALINDVLDISKIEAGQLEIASEPFDMRVAIDKVVRTVTPLAEKKGLALVAEVAPEVGHITSDRRRVEQILINLANNAIKFTEQGEVRIVCQVSDRRLVTRVVDTGIGIKPEDMGKLFEPFRQIETGLTRRHEGTGLGLSICKSLVEMLGGEIWADSEWGMGSTFTFTLPMKIGGENETQDTRHRG